MLLAASILPVLHRSRRIVDLGRERGVLRRDAARDDRARRLRQPDVQLPAAVQQAGPELLDRRRRSTRCSACRSACSGCRSRSARSSLILTAFFLARAAPIRRTEPRAGTRSKRRCGRRSAWPSRRGSMMFGRRIFIDIYISMFMALTLLFFALAERYPGAAAAVPAADVRVGRSGRADKGPGGGGAAGAGLRRSTCVVHGELRRVREMMIPAGVVVVLAIVVPVVRRALSALRLDLHHVVLRRREHRALHRGRRRRDAPRAAVLPAGRVQRFVPVVAVPVRRGRRCGWPMARAHGHVARLATAPTQTSPRISRPRRCCGSGSSASSRFFTFSAAKQDLYIFPIVPAVAALGGLFIARETAGRRAARPRSLRVTAGVDRLAPRGRRARDAVHLPDRREGLRAGRRRVRRRRGRDRRRRRAGARAARTARGAALAVVVLSLVTLNWVFVIRVLPSFERYKPVPPLSAAIQRAACRRRRGRALQRRAAEHGVLPRRHIDILFDHDAFLQTAARRPHACYAVLSRDRLRAARPRDRRRRHACSIGGRR